jgi:pilus assembly protein Flp/PilA
MEKIYTMMAVFLTGMYNRDESEDRGAGILEYALLVALIALIALAGITIFGEDLDTFFTNLSDNF